MGLYINCDKDILHVVKTRNGGKRKFYYMPSA